MYLRRDKKYIYPKFWGKVFWDYMFHYANNANFMKRNPLQHLRTLSFFIPCFKCKVEFMKKLRASTLQLKRMHKDKEALLRWIWQYKNEVNKRLNKKQITFKRAMKKQFGSEKKEHETFTMFYNKLLFTLPIANPVVPARYKYLKQTVCRKTAQLFGDILNMLKNRQLSLRTNHPSRIVPFENDKSCKYATLHCK